MSSLPLLALHIPDGFLSLPVAAAGWAILVVTIVFALRQTRARLGERQAPLMGVIAAFVFAAQMINFPVAGGTSGHLLGGTLVDQRRRCPGAAVSGWRAAGARL